MLTWATVAQVLVASTGVVALFAAVFVIFRKIPRPDAPPDVASLQQALDVLSGRLDALRGDQTEFVDKFDHYVRRQAVRRAREGRAAADAEVAPPAPPLTPAELKRQLRVNLQQGGRA